MKRQMLPRIVLVCQQAEFQRSHPDPGSRSPIKAAAAAPAPPQPSRSAPFQEAKPVASGRMACATHNGNFLATSANQHQCAVGDTLGCSMRDALLVNFALWGMILCAGLKLAVLIRINPLPSAAVPASLLRDCSFAAQELCPSASRDACRLQPISAAIGGGFFV